MSNDYSSDVQLGFPWDALQPDQPDDDVYMDKIGGKPIWLDKHPPSDEHATCSRCNRPRYLIAQILSILPSNPYQDRFLYVFACNNRQCVEQPGGLIALRVLRPITKPKPKPQVTKESNEAIKSDKKAKDASLTKPTKPVVRSFDSPSFVSFGSFGSFGDAPDTFSSQMDELADLLSKRDLKYASDEEDEPASQSQTLAKTAPKVKDKEKGKKTDVQASKYPQVEEELIVAPPTQSEIWSKVPSFPAYPLEFEPELSKEEKYDYEMRLLDQYKKSESDEVELDTGDAKESGGPEGWVGEGYEKVRPKHYNKAFKHFQRAVQRHPEQCVRYCHKGKPLFYSTDHIHQTLSTSGPPVCSKCGSPRVFEMQIMPATLSCLPTEQYAARTRKEENERSKSESELQGEISQTSEANLTQKVANPKGFDVSSILANLAIGLDFGTLLVYTCARDCGRDSKSVHYFTEYVVAQCENWR
ncbi:programmed cell death protein [Blyttiomyces sp. JEL0837]|nr:programmed cell death protein [Blyttiomyces sp. JEL0837]